MSKKIVIIGGVAGGATAAARLRRRDESIEIVMFERGEYISFANCGLPYHIGGSIPNRESLLLQTPEGMKQKFNMDVRILTEVIEIEADKKRVIARNLANNEVYEETYDELIISTGSSPLKPSIQGIELDSIYTLWNINDMDRIINQMENKNPKHATVVGGGFIGIEVAENLRERGLDVTLVEMSNQLMATVDYEMAKLLENHMTDHGVEIITSDGVTAFKKNDVGLTIELSSGKEIQTHMVILAIGVKPNSELAKQAGLELNDRSGIKVNEYLKTSDDNIYAVGDVIEVEHFISKEKTMIPLAGPANKQGRIVADNIVGDKKKYKGSIGSSVAKVFDLTVASVGLNEKVLKQAGKIKDKDYKTVLIQQKNHAGYYPNSNNIVLKMIFQEDGSILGSQIVGASGVDKRIDSIGTVMQLSGTIHDMAELELAYAPPYSSAKDPVNMLGFVAENMMDGIAKFTEWDEVDGIKKESNWQDRNIILDVTEEAERQASFIEGSYHIPLGQIRRRIQELSKDKHVIVYCAIGVRAYNAARILLQHGFSNVSMLSGGITFYNAMHQDNKKIIRSIHTKNMIESNHGKENKVSAASIGEEMNNEIIINKNIRVLDCNGLQCPGPIMKVNETVKSMKHGEILKVSATDMGFCRDIETWCKSTKNTFVEQSKIGNDYVAVIKKGIENQELEDKSNQLNSVDGKTMIVFSGDLDKVLASFIIANGAASMGRPVTMFFTFWGLNALRKSDKVSVKKGFMDAMFGFMMPRGSRRLKLSKMNMGGMGTMMMKKVMNDKNVDSLEDLMKHAMSNGVKIVACTMSMDIMGIRKEELIDGIEYAGVATYLGDAENSNVNLFI